MSTARRAAAALVGTLITAAFAAGPAVADPAAIAVATVPCVGYSTATFPAQPAAHPDVVARLTSVGARGMDDAFSGYGSPWPSFEAGDQIWGPAQPILAGVSPTKTLSWCSGGTVTVELFDRPTAPASLSGVLSSSGSVSGVPFTAATPANTSPTSPSIRARSS